jgi:hypothetical protein
MPNTSNKPIPPKPVFPVKPVPPRANLVPASVQLAKIVPAPVTQFATLVNRAPVQADPLERLRVQRCPIPKNLASEFSRDVTNANWHLQGLREGILRCQPQFVDLAARLKILMGAADRVGLDALRMGSPPTIGRLPIRLVEEVSSIQQSLAELVDNLPRQIADMQNLVYGLEVEATNINNG